MKISDLSLGLELEAVFSVGSSGSGEGSSVELYPPQEEAVREGLLDEKSENKNFVISSPTASGKTLLAELVMLNSVLREGRGKCLYVVPLNALANEKYRNFRAKFGGLVKVGISTGDYESSSRYLEKNDLSILTLEKLDSLTRVKPAWLREISVLVVDEAHVLGEEKRGPRLEGALARFVSLNPAARIVALSATIPNAAEFAEWLNAALVQSEWRPVPLREEVLLARNDRAVVERVLEEVQDGSQVLVFVNTKRGSASFARKIAERLNLRTAELDELDELDKLDELAERVEIGVDDLADLVRSGVAYHNSWLHPEQRKAVEEGFRARALKVICCTPTLAMGVSLPAKTVLIRNYKFFTQGRGNEPMPVCWVKQVFGRAGRPEHDAYGTGIIVAKSEAEFEAVEDFYLNGELERVESQFSVETLTEQILATVVGGANQTSQIRDFLNATFYAHQNRGEVERVKEELEEILAELSEDGFVEFERGGGKIRATEFGSLSSRLYLSTRSALALRDGINFLSTRNAETGTGISDFDLLLLLCRCEEVVPLRVKEAGEIATVLTENLEWLYGVGGGAVGSGAVGSGAVGSGAVGSGAGCGGAAVGVGSAVVAQAWIDELSYSEMKRRFGIYPGEIHNNVYVLGWICYAASRLAEHLQKENNEDAELSARLNVLKDRIKHGIRKDLLGLVCIKGVGRVIARWLHSAGFKSPEEVARAEVEQLERVPGVGAKRAKRLKEEALRLCKRQCKRQI